MKVSEYVAARFAFLGLTDVFSVTGGAAMHLNDAFGSSSDLEVHYMHSEQACSIAAEGYARIEWKPAIVCITAGPGAINALNGVFGAFTDSIPMIVISGQSRSDTLAPVRGMNDLRQFGDQELRTEEVVKTIAKWSTTVLDPIEIIEAVDQAFLLSRSGRPGPTWIDLPVNIQAMEVDADPEAMVPPNVMHRNPNILTEASDVADALRTSHRPLIMVGTGVRAAGVAELIPLLGREAGVPIVTAWTHDTISSQDPYFAGRPGTIGTRAGNLAVQSADLLLVLGSRLNVRQVSYNWESFARNALVIHVDVDEAELRKPYLKNERTIHADLKEFVPELIRALQDGTQGSHATWIDWCGKNRIDLEPRFEDYNETSEGINPYHFVMRLSELMKGGEIIACGDATATIIPFQVIEIKHGTRIFSNSGCASMGYDLPAGLGAQVAAKNSKVICLAGDGSVMMNLQELQTLAAWKSDLTLFILDNDGYLSIKQTQKNFFGRDHGSSPESGVTFPDFARVAEAFGLKATELRTGQDWEESLRLVLDTRGPQVCVVHLAGSQEFEPRLKSKLTSSGIVTPELDDMYPHLSDTEIAEYRESALRIGKV
jgi:acetolactate synthase-1/2/3 large subunit